MDNILVALGTMLNFLTNLGIILFQMIAVMLMLAACIITLIRFYKHQHHTVIQLRKWMNVALLFILCSEILRLINAHSLSEVGVIFFIVLIHGTISILSNWEMSREIQLYNQTHGVEECEKILNDHANDINL